MQELELQVEDLIHQKQDSTESVRIRELESERKLAEERIAELEAQLPRDATLGRSSDAGEITCSVTVSNRACVALHHRTPSTLPSIFCQ